MSNNTYGFDQDAALLKDSARKFFSEKLPVDKLHELVAKDPTLGREPLSNWSQELWREMIDLGWSMVAIPESAGGLGMPAVAVAGLMEECGRAAIPSPMLSTLATTYVLAAAEAMEPLADICSGEAATLAISGSRDAWDLASTEVTYSDGKLSGTSYYVQDVEKVQKILVSAHSNTDILLFWVDKRSTGVNIELDTIVDLTRDQGRVSFEAVEAEPISFKGLSALVEAMPKIWMLVSADIAGAAEWQLQTTVEYVNARKQFDRELGFFQAIKHPLVDVMIKVDETRSLLYSMANSISTTPEKATQLAHMLKASASDLAGFASGRSVQSHGGIGFTWECYVHLYFKRQKHSQMLFGDASWHRARLADILIGPVAA